MYVGDLGDSSLKKDFNEYLQGKGIPSWLTDGLKRRQCSGKQKGDNLSSQRETTATPLPCTLTPLHQLLLRFPLTTTRSGITGKGPPPVPERSKHRELEAVKSKIKLNILKLFQALNLLAWPLLWRWNPDDRLAFVPSKC